MATDLRFDQENGQSFTLRVLTMNCWGLRLISKFRRERMEAIAQEINNYHIVALQEVWCKDDFAEMQKIATQLPYSHIFYSGVIGSGLCVFSQYPIVGSCFHQFMSSGGIFDMHKGDLFAGKGVGMCRIKLTNNGCHLSIYTSHTYSRFRDSQLFEIMQFIHYTRGTDLVVMCGDLNTYPKMIGLKLFTKCLQLQDSFYHGECTPSSCSLCKNCHTCDKRDNMFVKKTANPKRIDYLFYSPRASCGFAIVKKEYYHVMEDPIPNRDYNYSDHVGIEVKLTVARDESAAQEILGDFSFIDNDEKRAVLVEIQDNIYKKKNELKSRNPLLSNEGIRKWFIVHLFKAMLCLVLMTLVPTPINIITNVLWAIVVCYWLRNFTGYVVELSHLAAVESNFQDLNNYLGRNGPPMPSSSVFPKVMYPNGDHIMTIN